MTDPLARIRQLYFKTTPQTVDQDFDRAVDLLKAIPSEAARERATVYMQGLAEMKREWTGRTKNKERRTKNRTSKQEP
jgi:hypothetical protein